MQINFADLCGSLCSLKHLAFIPAWVTFFIAPDRNFVSVRFQEIFAVCTMLMHAQVWSRSNGSSSPDNDLSGADADGRTDGRGR